MHSLIIMRVLVADTGTDSADAQGRTQRGGG